MTRFRSWTLLPLLLTLGLLAACLPPKASGGSGVAPGDSFLYTASPQGKVFALNPQSRSQNLPFPAPGEWVYPLNKKNLGVILATPAFSGNKLYVGTFQGKLLALETSTGNEVWSRELGGPIVASPAIAGDRLYVPSGRKLYALDGETGRELWGKPFETEGNLWATPLVHSDRIYLASLDHSLYTLNLEGKLLNRFPTRGALATSPLLVGERLFFGSFDGQLYALDATTGQPAWTQPFPASPWLWGKPLFGEGKLFIESTDKTLYALDAQGGLVWEKPLPAPSRSSPVMVEGLLVLALVTGDILALEPERGEERWRYNAGAPVRTDLLAREGQVYVQNQEGMLYSLEGTSGRVLWSLSLKER